MELIEKKTIKINNETITLFIFKRDNGKLVLWRGKDIEIRENHLFESYHENLINIFISKFIKSIPVK
jgi:hypothetical protein